MRRAILWLLSMLISLFGARTEPAACRVVTAVDVTASHAGQLRQYHYEKEEDMQRILNYVRRLESYAPVEIAADTFRADAFEIVLHRSDGTACVYHQIADGYLQRSDGIWVKLDPALASTLLYMLEAHPGENSP